MPKIPDTVSELELLWSLVALFGMAGTLIFAWIMARAMRVVMLFIRQNEASYSGPRWKFVFGFFVAMLLFFPGWLAFFLLGAVAGALPSPPPPPEPQPFKVETLFGLILFMGEICFAAGQTWLVVVWWMVRRAPGFVPGSITSVNDSLRHPEEL
jgi:hypothetical protein